MYANITDPRFATWRKSTRSGPSDNCVEVSAAAGLVALADSKAGPRSPIVIVDRAAFAAFVSGIGALRG